MPRRTRTVTDGSARAGLRFLWYRRAIGDSKSGLGPTWRLSTDELFDLIRAGARAINGSSRPAPLHGPARGETLEEVVEALARADDWTRRLSGFLNDLNDTESKAAVRRLVRLGCVPDELAWCVAEHKGPSEADAKRHDDIAHRTLLRTLAAEFDKAAAACGTYLSKTDELRYVGRVIGLKEWRNLYEDARRFRERAASLDTRRRVKWTRADSALYITMRDMRTITGQFQDSLLAALLRSVPHLRGTTSESLRKWRARHPSEAEK